MLTGWQTIDGASYYLAQNGDASHPEGALYISEKTPDGYDVDAEGKLIPKIVQETADPAARVNPYGNVNCVEIDLKMCIRDSNSSLRKTGTCAHRLP